MPAEAHIAINATLDDPQQSQCAKTPNQPSQKSARGGEKKKTLLECRTPSLHLSLTED